MEKEGQQDMNNTISVPRNTKLTVRQLALTGLMAAVICILGPWSIQIPVSPVPISLGFLAIYFVTSVMGMKLGTLSVIIYILLGLAGLPVFTGFTGGPGKLFGPTGGYIIGYIFMALICGLFVDKGGNRLLFNLPGMLAGTVVGYLFGTLWLAYQQSISFVDALFLGVIPYLGFDAVKLIVGMTIGSQLRKSLLKAGLLSCSVADLHRS